MAVLSIFSPGRLTVGGPDAHFHTQFVTNPWVICPVWIQCTTKAFAGSGASDFGIHEVEFFDDQGFFQKQTFGDPNRFDSLLARLFVRDFVSVTVAAHTFHTSIEGTLTLFKWG